ncbi:hypothetical protein RBB50_012462 [Rhinocladiella similis]
MECEDYQDLRDVDYVVSVFAKYLTREWKRTKAPRGFNDALQRAKTLTEETPEKILLDTGFYAWLSYFLAKQSNGTHYPGRAGILRTIKSFESFSLERQKEVGVKLNEISVHPTVLTAIEDKLKRPQNDRGFSQLTTINFDLSQGMTGLQSQNEIDPGSLHDQMQNDQNPSLQQSQSSGQLNMINSAARTDSEMTSLARSGPNVQTASHPPARQLPTIFPPYMAHAIRKSDDRAHLEMVFPYSLGMVCISLAILSAKVEYIAMELFGIHVETEAGFRYIDQGDGARVLIQGEVILQGAKDEAITKLFGLQMSNDFNASPARQKEIDLGICRTRFVTMQITSNPGEDSVVTISIGEEEAFRVKEILFR